MDGHRPHPETDLHAHRDLRALRGHGPGHLELLVEEILEVHPALLESGGVHVGQVVGDGVELKLLALHSGSGTPERPNHPLTSF